VASFHHLTTKKKGLANPRKGFLRIKKKKIATSRGKKKQLEVARFRQCVALDRQN
jgi:hypothetical protein